ncbi:MAG: glycosyltransferase [Clostridia bacterium]|nr:glycosyltransferase [Clostridia bacterium]
MKISVIIPAYNEEDIIAEMLSEYWSFLTNNFTEFEIIVVDDGSLDKTLEIAKSFENTICISYKKNKGKGYAVKRGFLRATGDYIFFTDADLSYSPENISRAISIFQKTKASGVMGIRTNIDRDYPFFRRLVSKIFAKLVRYVISTNVTDTQCGFKGFEKSTGKQIFSRSQIFDFGFDFEVIYLSGVLGKPLATLPVSFKHRKETKVHMLRDSVRILKDLIYIKRSSFNENIQKTV